MKRFLVLLLLVGVGSLPVACGSKSSPTTASSGGSFSYPFLFNFGTYMTNTFSNSFCGVNDPEAGAFYDVTGVAIGNGYVFVGDDSEEDIQVFDMNGNFITWFWPYTSWGALNYYPEGMKAANGKLYVADYQNSTVDVYNIADIISQAAQTLACNNIYAFASYWNNSSSCGVYDVDVDNSGNMYVADYCAGTNSTGLISVIAPDLNYYTAVNDGYNGGDDVIASTDMGVTSLNGGYLYYPYGVAVDPSGQHVYAADGDNEGVQKYSFDGANLVSTGFIGEPTGAATTVAGQFNGPWGIRVDNQGNLIVADNGNARVQRLTTGGSVLNVIGASATVNGGLYSPAYVAVDSTNNLYVTDNNVDTVNVYSSK